MVRNYTHYSEEQIWSLTIPQLELEHFMAMKALKRQSQFIAAALAGAF